MAVICFSLVQYTNYIAKAEFTENLIKILNMILFLFFGNILFYVCAFKSENFNQACCYSNCTTAVHMNMTKIKAERAVVA